MFWANRSDKVVGVLLLIIPALSLIGFIGGVPLGEVDPFSPSDVEVMLTAIHENFGLWASSLVPFIVQDMLGVAAAALLYIAFRDRSRTLALAGALAAVAGFAALMAHEVGAMTLAFLSSDFFGQGGAGAITAGDSGILVVSRAVSVSQALSALIGQTMLGLGVALFGILIAWAPRGVNNPPRWLGLVGLIGGVLAVGTWVFLVNHLAGGGVTLLSEVGVLVMYVGLGTWFLRSSKRRRGPESRPMSQSQQPTTSTAVGDA
jgi:hypothetical protein